MIVSASSSGANGASPPVDTNISPRVRVLKPWLLEMHPPLWWSLARLSEIFIQKPEALSDVLTRKSRVLILCTPSNPTGSVHSLEDLEAIAAVVAKYPHLLVISDEIYEHYQECGNAPSQ